MVKRITQSRPGSQVAAYYEIKVSGELDSRWSQWFSGVEIGVEQLGDGLSLTKLRCRSLDQAKLRGMLNKIWDLNLELVSVQRFPDPSVEEPDGYNFSRPLGNQLEDGG